MAPSSAADASVFIAVIKPAAAIAASVKQSGDSRSPHSFLPFVAPWPASRADADNTARVRTRFRSGQHRIVQLSVIGAGFLPSSPALKLTAGMVYSFHDTVIPKPFPAKANRRSEEWLSILPME
jgi:hypothetical protein